MQFSSDQAGFGSHTSLHQSAIDQLVALALGHGQQVFRRVAARLGPTAVLMIVAPSDDRKCPSI
jgi:hypothetical protein